MKTLLITLVLFSIHVSAFAQIKENIYDIGKTTGEVTNVSIISLLTKPDAYKGKSIRVVGFFYGSYDGSYLFLTKDHALLFDKTNAIPVAQKINGDYIPEHFIGRYVMIEGGFTYYEELKGYCISPVTRIAVRPVFINIDQEKSEEQPKGDAVHTHPQAEVSGTGQ